MSVGECVFIVDDEPNIVQLSRMYLEREGFTVASSGNGKDAFERIQHIRPALIILDLMLPEIDGMQICRKLREVKNKVPILMLTARDEDIDKILGLEMGADDYMTKPFNPRELVARVKAILRRSDPTKPTMETTQFIGDLSIDPARREVHCKDKLIDLRHQEFNLLQVLVEHKGLALTREKLLNLAWGYDYFGNTRTVDVHIGMLRKKLSDSQVRIETVPNYGYKLII
jgi:two-component system alkaline phosphatase synthesis response regulator PhoP